MNPGRQAAQLVHGAYIFQKEYPNIQDVWYNISNYVALLSCENEQALKDLIAKAKEKDINCSVFTEPDLNDSITSIVLEPCEEASKMCSSLQLAFKEYNDYFKNFIRKEVASGN